MLHIQPALETPDPQTRVSEINFIAAQVALLYREPVLTRKGNSSTPILTTEAECHPLQYTSARLPVKIVAERMASPKCL